MHEQQPDLDPSLPPVTVSTRHASRKGFLHQFTPATAYVFGVLTSLSLVFAIGFFILLGIVVQGKVIALTTSGGGASAPVAAAPTAGDMPSATVTVPQITDKDHVRGKGDAKVTLIEFSDLECPFCKQFHPAIDQVAGQYGDRVRFVYKHFPLDQIHPKARKEAEASECAAEVGGKDMFWKYVSRLFEVTPGNNGLDPAQLPEIAKGLGVDEKKFNDCLSSGKYASKVQEDYQAALAAGAQGTPYSLIVAGDQKIPLSGAMSADELKQVLDTLLAQ